jgi:hypothetical protein
MKILKNEEEIPDRIYYYLLDWNDNDNKETLRSQFKKDSLHDLTKHEVGKLFEIATEIDNANHLNFYYHVRVE